tara:strand:- start:1948 stop:3168 length:1221 start_codon:yes stop_codon:yes gene_type:complete
METKSQHLLSLLKSYNFKINKRHKCANFRKGHQTINVGYTQHVLTRANKVVPSKAMIENKSEIYNECKKLFPDFEFNSVQINKNFKCDPHYDSKNSGISLIMALGDFTGGELSIEGEDHDIRYKPITFNGNLKKHWVKDFQGERYSIVLFNLKQSCKWKIAIPSYNRPDALRDKTLKTLAEAGINSGITIFVANEDEKKRYRERIKKIRIVVGVIGITAQRNFIKKYYKQVNDCILVLDDDIERFETINKETNKFEKITDLKSLFTDCFITAKNNNVNLWGIYGARNCMFMARQKTKFKLGFSFLIGCVYGYIVEKDMTPYLMDENVKIKQDYEQSVLHYKEMGNILRFNWVTIKTKFYAEGGLGKKPERQQQNLIDQKILTQKYPEYFKPKFRKDGTAELYVRRL